MSAPEAVRVALYSRVSTADQSLDPQWLELRAWVARQGWSIVGEFSDVMSGARGERPGLQRMLEYCAAGKVQVVACVKLDRLGRSVLNVASLVERLEKLGAALVCTSQGIDTREGNPCGRLQLAMLSAVAAFERDLIRERTKAGLKAAVAKGKRLGRKPRERDAEADEQLVAAWREAGRPGGLRGLAQQLGVASPMTAGRIEARVMEAANETAL